MSCCLGAAPGAPKTVSLQRIYPAPVITCPTPAPETAHKPNKIAADSEQEQKGGLRLIVLFHHKKKAVLF
jgi:hypothetical protein